MRRVVEPGRIVAAVIAVILAIASTQAQGQPSTTVAVHVTMPAARKAAADAVPAAAWLVPIGRHATPPGPRGPYTLLQKDRMFSPHLLIVPVGSVVRFPNEDPFFHNVFSLFDGKRFDLGLYEAGKTRDVAFAREGLSYIFCNIHPEMSAVVIALSTPLYASGTAPGTIAMRGVPPGEYDVHLWVEGQNQFAPSPPARRIVVRDGVEHQDVAVAVKSSSGKIVPHTNEYGQPYSYPARPIY